jgi:hypothetical protein
MAVHDWFHVSPGIFHDFHQAWINEIRKALNSGMLPPGFFAMAEQVLGGPIPDVIALEFQKRDHTAMSSEGGIAVANAPPRARFVASAEANAYARKANQIVISHELGRVVAVIEIVSPGNKSNGHAIRSFVEKTRDLLAEGINLLIVDLFPPTARDPQGIHKAIWDALEDSEFELPADKPLTVAAYSAGLRTTAYVEPVSVGDPLPSLPIFLDEGTYVPAPLESTYQTTWATCPAPMRELVEAR